MHMHRHTQACQFSVEIHMPYTTGPKTRYVVMCAYQHYLVYHFKSKTKKNMLKITKKKQYK